MTLDCMYKVSLFAKTFSYQIIEISDDIYETVLEEIKINNFCCKYMRVIKH